MAASQTLSRFSASSSGSVKRCLSLLTSPLSNYPYLTLFTPRLVAGSKRPLRYTLPENFWSRIKSPESVSMISDGSWGRLMSRKPSNHVENSSCLTGSPRSPRSPRPRPIVTATSFHIRGESMDKVFEVSDVEFPACLDLVGFTVQQNRDLSFPRNPKFQ